MGDVTFSLETLTKLSDHRREVLKDGTPRESIEAEEAIINYIDLFPSLPSFAFDGIRRACRSRIMQHEEKLVPPKQSTRESPRPSIVPPPTP
jgi:hypothetical protein